MATYAFRDAAGDLVLNAPEFAKPTPAHAQTPGALQAVEAVRAAGRLKRSKLDDAEIVIDLGRPPVEPFMMPETVTRITKKGKRKVEQTGRMIPRDPVTASARRLIAHAEAAGMRTNVIALSDRCTVEAIDAARGIAFRAFWTRGAAKGGTWHERSYRYTLVADSRPVGVDKNKRTGLKGKRAAGVGETHLAIVASPVGVPCNITEIERRVKEL